jgi:hypothetical protein
MPATHSLDLESSSSQYASIADASAPNLEISGSQTFEAWIKPESFADFRVIMAKANSTNVHDFYMGSNAKPVFRLAGLSTNTSVTYTGTLIAGVWVHVAGVYDSSATKLRLYINGELDNEVTASGSAVDTNGNFYIGANDAGTYFDGLIRNARVWNVARTQQEIRDNMNIDTPTGTGLQGNWILNNAYTDSSGNGYTLTASGSPVFSTTYPDAINLTENGAFTKKHKIVVQASQVPGSTDLTDVPIVLTESNFFSSVFDNTQGQEINTNALKSDSSLKAYYRFESGALTTDSSGNGYTLTNNNSATEITGKFSGGVNFNGTNQRMSVAASGFFTTGSQSFSLWAKIDSISTTNSYLITFWDSSNNALGIRQANVAGATGLLDLSFTMSNLSGTDQVSCYRLNEWFHVAAIYDSVNNKRQMYVNNVLVLNATTTGTVTNQSSPSLYIGGNGTTSYTDGIIDDVAFFNRTLSQAEVEAIYKGGADLRFSTDIAGKTRLAHEVVSWDTAGKTGEVWVKANTLGATINTPIYVHYKNPTASALDENEAFGKHQVYPSAWKLFSHLENNSIDSTLNNNDGTNTNITFSTTNGKIKIGSGYNGTSSKIAITNNATLRPTTAFWVSAWVKTSSNANQCIIASYTQNANPAGWIMVVNTSGKLLFLTGNNTGLSQGTTYQQVIGNTTIRDGNWHFVVGYWSGTQLRVFIDGVEDATAVSWSTAPAYSASNSIKYGVNEYAPSLNDSWFNGAIDQVSVYVGTITPDYITTLYNNQNSPATFAIPQSTAGGAFLLQFV